MIAQNARQIQLRSRRVKLRLAARSRQVEREWTFLCKRFNASIRFTNLGAAARLPAYRSFLMASPSFVCIIVHCLLSSEEVRAQIARQFKYLAENYGTPEQAAATRAILWQRTQDLAAWKDGASTPEWIKRPQAL